MGTYALKDVGFNALYPDWLKNITVVGEIAELNNEMVLMVSPDVVISGPGPVVEQMEEIKIPVVVVSRHPEIPENIRFIGRVIGNEKEAEELASYYEEKITFAINRTADIPENERKKVYYVAGPDPLKTVGGGFGNYPLFRYAGGVLVSENLTGSWGTDVSMEQVLKWDPDVIVVGYGWGIEPEDILSDPKWQGIKAVKTGDVYIEPPPHCACLKKHPSACLGTLWLAQKLYPDRFEDTDIHKEVEDFVQKFYGMHWEATFE